MLGKALEVLLGLEIYNGLTTIPLTSTLSVPVVVVAS